MTHLLITGFKRSGTTLTARFLGAQDRATVIPDLLNSIFTSADGLGIETFHHSLSERQRNVLLSGLQAELSLKGLPPDSLSPHFSTVSELYGQALTALRGDDESVIVGTKVTGVVSHAEAVLALPDFHVIYVLRDPRDVLLSHKNRFPRYRVLDSLIDLISDLEAALSIDHPRFHLLQFEHLLLDTERVAEELGDVLGTPVDPHATPSSEEWHANTSFHDLSRFLDPGAVGRWRENDGAEEVKLVDAVMPHLLDRFGYESTGTFQPMELAGARARFRAYRAVRSLKSTAKRAIEETSELLNPG